MVPLSPTATSSVGEAATPRSEEAVPLERGVQVMPSGDVAMAPPLPTATNWRPVQNAFRSVPPVGGVRVVQVIPPSADVAMQAPMSDVPTATRRPLSEAARVPLQGT